MNRKAWIDVKGRSGSASGRLEAELVRLRAIVDKPAEPEEPWWKTIAGKYANDPDFDEAMRLGREYHESLRPKPRTRKKV